MAIRYQISDGSARFSGLCAEADFIQIREPKLSARELTAFVRRAIALGPRVLVNDRADVAIACGAAGVHLRSGSIAPARIREIAPARFIVTVACHCLEDAQAAEGADYAILAPIFTPLSKADTRPPLGLETLHAIAMQCSIPILALGGVTDANARHCVEAGAAGVAGITLFLR